MGTPRVERESARDYFCTIAETNQPDEVEHHHPDVAARRHVARTPARIGEPVESRFRGGHRL